MDGPLDRIRQGGIRGADARDLLCVCLASREDVVDAGEDRARDLVRRRGLVGLADLARLDYEEYSALDEFSIFRLQCAIELGRKIGLARNAQTRTLVRTPEDAAEAFADLAEETREHFCALFLDTKGGILSRKTIHIGTLTMSLVGAREVFREAVRESASTIIVAHNHPSGDPTPSPEDIEVTTRLYEAGELLDIELRDHIIIGRGKWTSLRRQGVLG